MIIVEAQMDLMGNIVIAPRNKRVARKYEKHMKEMTGYETSEAFFQEGMGVHEVMSNHIPKSHHKHLEMGHKVSFKIDPWYFGMMLGYDAHNVEVSF